VQDHFELVACDSAKQAYIGNIADVRFKGARGAEQGDAVVHGDHMPSCGQELLDEVSTNESR
jgi:hypothetical protein